jgi:hypothetical protein
MKMIHQVYNSILYSVVNFYLSLRQGELKILGPLNYAQHSEIIHDALEFHKNNNIQKAPYLYTDFQKDIDSSLEINERSSHFVVLNKNQILCYLKLTPYPFEITKIIKGKQFDFEELEKYFEFSRFSTSNQLANKRFYAKLLLLKAGHWLFTKTKAEGIIGICKENRLSYFRLFNLFPMNKDYLEVQGRPGKYFLVSGKKQNVLFAISNFLISKINFNYYKGKSYELRTIKKHP